MIWQNSIDVGGDLQTVFTAFTSNAEPTRHDANVIECWHSGGPLRQPGQQTVWRILYDRMVLEVVETLIEFDEPTHLASAVTFTRFLPLPTDLLRKNEMAVVGDELDSMFRMAFGQKPPEGLNYVEFTALSPCMTRISKTQDMKFGGLSWVLAPLQRLRNFSPLVAQMEAFRASFEGAN